MSREDFLNSILSNSTNKYKPVISSPIRYAGGKSLGVGHVFEVLPDTVKKVISPFFGGGSVEIAMSKYLGLEVIGHDIFDILTNYWHYQINHPEELYQKLRKLEPTQETYLSIKNKLEDHWDKTTKTFEEWAKRCKKYKRYQNLPDAEMQAEWDKKQILEGMELAVCYFFNFNMSYGPCFLGWGSKIYLNDRKYNAVLKNVKNFQPGNLQVHCADFEEVFKKYPNDFFYCDPPYFIGPGSKMFQGIYPMKNFPVHHDGFKHELLAQLLNDHKGGFILSYNDCPQVRSWYQDFQQTFPDWQYSLGRGETRVGKFRKKLEYADQLKESHEILIFAPPKF